MKNTNKHFKKILDQNGNTAYVQIDAELWQMIEKKVSLHIEKALLLMYPQEKPEPLDEWKEFQDCWDFKYPYEASVNCQNCGNSSEDWQQDAEKNFRLKSASLSGLVIFKCCKCNADVRKKHFKDHICYECSTNSCNEIQ